MTTSCDTCSKEFKAIDRRRFCTIGCEITWWAGCQGIEANAENIILRADLDALQAENERMERERDKAVTDRDEWARQCNMASEAQADALSRESKLREALSELLGKSHNLKSAFSTVRRWGDDPVFVDKAQREQECARIERFVNEWHSILCAALGEKS